LLFFDDVEEEFGVGVPYNDAILRELGHLWENWARQKPRFYARSMSWTASAAFRTPKGQTISRRASILEATGRNVEAIETRDRAERLFEQSKRQNEVEGQLD
jgi:hypothetical protein